LAKKGEWENNNGTDEYKDWKRRGNGRITMGRANIRIGRNTGERREGFSHKEMVKRKE
jgi:hypothetical protein